MRYLILLFLLACPSFAQAVPPPQSTLHQHTRLETFRSHHPILQRFHERRAINWQRVKKVVVFLVQIFLVVAPWVI